MDKYVLVVVLATVFLSGVASAQVEIGSDVTIHQNGNNASINITDTFNTSDLSVHSSSTEFGGSNFSILPDSGSFTTVRLNWYNASAEDYSYVANFSADTDPNSNTTFKFSDLDSNQFYQAEQSDSVIEYSETSSTGLFSFYSSDWEGDVFQGFNVQKYPNQAPEIASSKFIDDRQSDFSRLVFGIDDKSENDIESYTGLSSVFEFTNSSLKSAISFPYSSTVSVEDSAGAVSNTYNVDLSETDSGVREDSFDHSESLQRINRTVTLFNDAVSSIDYELVLDLAGTVVQGQSWTGTIPGSGSVTHTAVTEGDWIDVTESDVYTDSSNVQTLDTQYLEKSKLLTATGGFNFSSVNVSAPDISGDCSDCSQRVADVETGNPGTFSGESFYDGTINGASWTDGRYGEALSFDGSDDFVDVLVSDSSFNHSSGFSIVAEISPETLSGTDRIFTKDRDYSFGVVGSDLKFTTLGKKDYIINADVTKNKNQTVVITYDSSFNASGYIDGVYHGSVQGSQGADRTSSDVTLGSRQGQGNEPFHGKINYIRFYNKTLSKTEIQAIENSNKFIREDLEAYWRFNAGSGGTAFDTHHRVSSFNAEGDAGVSFDGQDDIVDVGERTIDTTSSNYSISTKFRIEEGASNFIFGRFPKFGIRIENGRVNSWHNNYAGNIGSGLDDGEIHTVTVNWNTDENHKEVYIDGDFVGTDNAWNSDFSFTNPVYIGDSSNWNAYDVSLNGSVYYVNFYNRTLSASEVQELRENPMSVQNGLQNSYQFESGVDNAIFDSSNGGFETYDSSGDWILSEVESSYDKYSDADYDHSEDSQRIHNRTQLDVDNTRSFTFNNVDISSTCSQTTSTDVPSGASTVTTDCNRATFLVDTISQSVTDLQQDASNPSSLSTQYVFKRKDLTENSGYSYSSVDISSPSLDGSCSNCNSRTRDIGASSTVSEFYNSSSDWITNEQESTYTKYSNSGFDHTEDGQQIVNRTQLVADNSQSFTFNNVDISSTCSETTSADVSPATGFLVTDDCNRPEFSVDFISESVGEEFVDSSFSHSLSSQGLALYKNISETGGYSFNEVNVSSPVLDGTCENCVERTTDISGNGEASFVYNSTGDWITGENRSTFSKYSDTGFNHTEDGQRIVNRTKLVVDNERSSEFRDVDLSSTCSETASGSVASGSGVEVTTDCTRNSFTGDWISTDTSEEASDSSFGHSLDSQGVFVAKNLSEEGGFSWSNVSVSTPAINGSCENCGMRNVSLDEDGSTTEYYNASSDWINVVSESTTEIGQNTSIEATVGSQTLYNQSRLSVDNNRSFSFNDVDVSSKCSTTTSVDVPSGQSVVTEACNNDSFTGDWITNEENTSTQYVSGDVLIGEEATESFEASQDVEVTNVRSDSDLSVNLDSMLESVPGCNLQNSTTQNIPASTASSLDFLKSCSPGQHLNRTAVVKTETSDFYKYDIEFGFEVESNLTEEQDIRYAAKKEWLDNWNSRDPTETEVSVNGRSQDVSVSEQIINDTEYVVVTVGDEYGNSSLHKGTHEASLSYYETKSPGSTGGTSGGAPTLISSSSGEERLVENVSSDKYNWTVSIVSTDDTQSYQVSGYPGASFENFIVLENTGDSNVTLDIECEDVKEACDWVDVSVDRVVLNRNDFSEKVVTVSGDIPESFGGEDAPASFSIKVSDPRANGTEGSDVGVEYVDFTVTNNPISGRVLDTALKVFEWRELESPVSWGNPVPYPFVFLPAFWTLLFAGAWWGLERVSPVKSRPDSRWVVSIGLFLLLFVVL